MDSSAIVKLIVKEQESEPLLEYLSERPTLVSSALAKTEVRRSLLLSNPEVQTRGEATLEAIELISISDDVLDSASALQPPTLRSLDSIHLATCLLLESDLEVLVTYDKRMLDGAVLMGLTAVSPGTP